MVSFISFISTFSYSLPNRFAVFSIGSSLLHISCMILGVTSILGWWDSYMLGPVKILPQPFEDSRTCLWKSGEAPDPIGGSWFRLSSSHLTQLYSDFPYPNLSRILIILTNYKTTQCYARTGGPCRRSLSVEYMATYWRIGETRGMKLSCVQTATLKLNLEILSIQFNLLKVESISSCDARQPYLEILFSDTNMRTSWNGYRAT